MREALLYEEAGERLRCLLCAHHCLISEGETGICRVRVHRGGKLYTLVYGRVVAAHVDPIEKKPLYHFLPGTKAFSVATVGCNFRCGWCQNWLISQMPVDRGRIEGEPTEPEQVVAAAQRSGCASISYTYTEPTVFFEFALDTARLAHARGLKNSFVTNGYMSDKALDMIAPYLDAANVDLKAFSDVVYKRYCGARLAPVLDTLRGMKKAGVWVEVTTLVIPGINDDDEQLRGMARFIATELGPETPWHLSRAHPDYRMEFLNPTPLATLERALRLAQEHGLAHVYLGNVATETPTRCASCGEVLIRRRGFWLEAYLLTPEGRCPRCGKALAGKGLAATRGS